MGADLSTAITLLNGLKEFLQTFEKTGFFHRRKRLIRFAMKMECHLNSNGQVYLNGSFFTIMKERRTQGRVTPKKNLSELLSVRL
jgi:hypothetical protein